MEASLESEQRGVWIALELKGIWHNFYWPTAQLGVLASFEAKMEKTRVFGINAESIHAALWIRLRVSFEPFLYNLN